MARVIIEHGFKYAFRGVEVVEYTASEEEQDLPAEVSNLAVQEGWARLPEPAPAEPSVAQDEAEPAPAEPAVAQDEAEPAPAEPAVAQDEAEPAPAEPAVAQDEAAAKPTKRK